VLVVSLLSVEVKPSSAFDSKERKQRYKQIPILTELSKLCFKRKLMGETFMVHS
jgi:hypothetical protein